MSLELSLKDQFFLPHLACDIKLSVKEGAIHVISGENGIGKSTFLRKIAEQNKLGHIVHAEQGALDFFFDRKLGKFKEIVESSEEVDHDFFRKLWTDSGLSAKEERFLSRLSGGEAQMVKLICVCSAKGEVFLLDEPGQYLDPGKKKLADEIFRKLISQNKTLIIVEHDPGWITGVGSHSELSIEDGILKAEAR